MKLPLDPIKRPSSSINPEQLNIRQSEWNAAFTAAVAQANAAGESGVFYCKAIRAYDKWKEVGQIPYDKWSKVNPALKGIKPKVTLAQANMIARWADRIAKGAKGVKSPWAVAIGMFKRAYKAQDGKWVKKEAKSVDKNKGKEARGKPKPVEKKGISNKSWSEVNKSLLPASCFLIVGDSKKPTTWKLPYREADPAGGKYGKDTPRGLRGRYKKAGSINAGAIRAILAAIGGARVKPGSKKLVVPADVVAKVKRMAKQFGIGAPAEKGKEAVSGDVSGFIEKVHAAWDAQYGGIDQPVETKSRGWVHKIYDDHVTVKAGDDFYSIPFTMEDDEIQFAPKEEWDKIEYVEKVVEGQASERGVTALEAKDPEGKVWEVTIIGPRKPEDIVEIGGEKYLRTANRRYLLSALEKAAPLFEGVKVYDNHLTDSEFEEKEGMRSVVKEWLGVIQEPWWEEPEVKGLVKVVDKAAREKLMEAKELGVLDEIGLSWDVHYKGIQETIGDKAEQVVLEITKVNSVDVVADPGSGGGFNRVLASEQTQKMEVENMTKQELQEMLGEMIPQAVATALKEQAPPVEEAVVEEPGEGEPAGQEPVGESGHGGDDYTGVIESLKAEVDEAKKEFQEAAKEAKLQACEAKLGMELERSGLPAQWQKSVQKRFEGRVFEAAELGEALKEARDLFAETIKEHKVKGLGASGIEVKDFVDRAQEMADVIFDPRLRFREADSYKDTPRNIGIRGLYLALTGDEDFRGIFNARAVEANVTTTTFNSVVKNAVNKRLLSAYGRRERWWEQLVTPYDEKDLRNVTLIKTGAFAMLDAVGEGGAYTEKAITDVEETASFQKYGNYIGVTLEAIINDDVRAIGRLTDDLGYGAWKRISYLMAYLFTQGSDLGPTLGQDTTRWFDATHSNLGSSALTPANWAATIQAIYEQADPAGTAGQDELALRPAFLLVPIELERTALQVIGRTFLPLPTGVQQQAYEPGTMDRDLNVYQGTAKVVTVPNWTDAAKWAALCDPADMEVITMHYFNGRREPETFVADDPLTGAMFTNDEMRIKVRFWIGIGVADYRGVYKHNL